MKRLSSPSPGFLKGCILLLTGFLLASCTGSRQAPIDLNRLYPLASPDSHDIVPLRVAVAAVISPQGSAESYRELIEYMSEYLSRPVEMVQRANYKEVNDLLQSGQVDVAFVCTGAYIAGSRDFGMEILVVPEINGETSYYSWLIVPQGSPAKEMADLRGKTFAFTDPLSHTGRLYPTYLVLQLGETPETFFGRTFYTYSHDAAIEAVAGGVADGAAVDHLIYLYLIERRPDLESSLRIIHRSPPFGIPPVVVSPTIRPQLKVELQELFLRMHTDRGGKAALQVLDIDRFLLLDDSAYDSTREVEAAVGSITRSDP
jgi:phosphonate transport system substrate-binding protein